MSAVLRTGLRLIAGGIVPAVVISNAIAQTGTQNYTLDLEDIVIATDLVAPVVSIEDSITEPSRPDPDMDEATVTAEPELSRDKKQAGGNIFAGLSATDTEVESVDPVTDSIAFEDTADVATADSPGETGTTVNEVASTTVVQQSGAGASIFSEVEPGAPELSPAPVQPKATEQEIAITNAPPAATDVVLTEPETGASAPLVPDQSQQQAIDEDLIIAGWANAWSNNDVEAYLDYYADDFVPADPAMDRQSWEQLRRQRLENEDIRIIVSNADLSSVGPQHVEVRFTQRYTSKNYRDRVIKAIEMKHTDDGWKFISERTVEELPFK